MQFTEAAAQELAEFQQYFGGRDLHPSLSASDRILRREATASGAASCS
jgi:hypothetical protein